MTQSSRLSKLLDTLQNDLPIEGTILIVRATDNPAYRRFNTAHIHCLQSFKPTYDALIRSGVEPKEDYPNEAVFGFVELSRTKNENLSNIAKAYAALSVGATLIIDGAKTDGIDSILKVVKKRIGVDGNYSKTHGRSIWLTKLDRNNPFQDWLSLTEMTKNADDYWTIPGVFSADAIDPASALLISKICQPLKGKGADLGSGWGYLSERALAIYPDITQLDLFEAERIGLDCARKNIADARAAFYWEDVQSMPTKAIYDFITMNPPFHQSRKADLAIGRDFIAKAAKLLHSKGQLWMVANKQLAYEATLDENFKDWSYVDQTSQYKIIHARKPK